MHRTMSWLLIGSALISAARATEPFTDIVSGLDWAATNVLTELRLSVAERAYLHQGNPTWQTGKSYGGWYSAGISFPSVIYFTNQLWICRTTHTSGTWADDLAAGKWMTPDVVAGEDVQSAGFWNPMYNSIYAMLTPSSDSPGYYNRGFADALVAATNRTSFPNYSITDPWWLRQSDMDEAAGLSTNGWRMATSWNPAIDDWTDVEDDMFDHEAIDGSTVMAGGDIIGPWVLDDIQKALSAMHLYLYTGTPAGTSNEYQRSEQVGSPLAAAHTNCATVYALYDWGSAATNIYADTPDTRAYAAHNLSYAPLADRWYHVFVGNRYASYYTRNGITTLWPHSAALYAMPRVWDEYTDFSDIDGYGLVESNYFEMATFALATTNTRASDLLFEIESDPLDVADVDCSDTPDYRVGYSLDFDLWVMDWDFSFSD